MGPGYREGGVGGNGLVILLSGVREEIFSFILFWGIFGLILPSVTSERMYSEIDSQHNVEEMGRDQVGKVDLVICFGEYLSWDWNTVFRIFVQVF